MIQTASRRKIIYGIVCGLLLIILLCSPASAAHTFDTSATAGTTSFATTPNPRTLSYTAGSGSTLMVVSIFRNTTTGADRAGGAPTFNGKTMTLITAPTITSSYESGNEMWYLLLTPSDTGSAQTVSVPNTGALGLRFHVSTYKSATGQSQLDSYNTDIQTSGSNPSASVTSTVNGDVYVSSLSDGVSTPPTAVNVGTALYMQDGGSYSASTSYYLQSTASAQAITWTVATDDHVLIVAAFKEAASAGSTYKLSGYIANKSNGYPINGATVETNTSRTTTTNSTGYYNFTGLSNGTYNITATFSGYSSNFTIKTINGANVTNANISLSPVPTYLLSGYVKDQTSGAAISSATVVTDTDLTTSTNAAGYYNFTVSNGTILITASKTGYNSNSTTRTVNGAAVSNANISLTLTPPSAGGKILVATNRYVIIDDPITGTAYTAGGFANPFYSYSGWT